MPDAHTRYVVGCMTGTSLDGLDVVLAQIDGQGLALAGQLIDILERPLDALADELAYLATGGEAEALRFVAAARKLGQLHADAVEQLCKRSLPTGAVLDFVVAHGQTIVHAPDQAGGGLSWQLFDPWPLVRRLGVPVCYDLRQADLIAGGQGAPITPLSDWIMFRDEDRPRVVVNLGGICNVTYLPAACRPTDVQAEDLGPCNLLIDGTVRWAFPGVRFDEGGILGASGRRSKVMSDLLASSAPFFARPRPRTTGREDFGSTWLKGFLDRAGLTGHDALTGATEAVADMIAEYVGRLADDVEVILAGGGAQNLFLIDLIGQKLSERARVITSATLGIPVTAREALGLAVLGTVTRDGVALTLEQVTGANQPGRGGAWAYP